MTSAMSEERTAEERATGAVVQASEITRVYGEGDTAVHALNGCSLAVSRGELTAIMGPSGSGKSTMMHILAGLDRPTEGSVSIEGTDITKLGDNELTKLRRKHIGFIFQFFNLLPMLTAEENIRLPLELAGGKIDTEWLDEVIKRTGLDDRRTHRPSELSGGQQQRVAIARALASQADRHLRRRADGQPRLGHERRDPRPPARDGRRLRADDRHGHARRPRRGDRQPDPLPGRRLHRQGAQGREPG